MKFTIVTSFYNNLEYIEKLYNCILSQTYTNWEWIVTDDFSSDDSKSLLLSIAEKDKRVIYVEQTKKKEMFWNPQFFCKNAEIILELGSDDYIVPKSLEVYHHFFTKFPNVMLIGCFADSYHEDNTWANFLCEDYNTINNLLSGKMLFMRAWRNNPNIAFDFNPNDWMKFFYNDLSILCTVEEYGKILCLPRVLYSVNVRKDSISRSHYSNISEVREENDKLVDLIRSRRIDPDFDSLERYFDPLYDDVFNFSDLELNNYSTQKRISLISPEIISYKKRLFKELYFDMDFRFNEISEKNDITIYSIISENDLKYFFENFDNNYHITGGKIYVSSPRSRKLNEFSKFSILDFLQPKYNLSYKFGASDDLTISLF